VENAHARVAQKAAEAGGASAKLNGDLHLARQRALTLESW
jgi:hypothetical protein